MERERVEREGIKEEEREREWSVGIERQINRERDREDEREKCDESKWKLKGFSEKKK